MQSKKNQIGVSLLELILVLVVGSSILYLGFRQYLYARSDADVLQLQANIDTIFSGMALYHKQNCYGQVNPRAISPTLPLTPGTLNPVHVPPPNDPYLINIATDLVAQGFIVTSLTTVVPLNPIVNSSDASYGYIAQFNKYESPRYVCNTPAVNSSTGPTTAQKCANESGALTQIGTIVNWRPQIAIHLKQPSLINQYQQLLNADCISSVASDNTVYACGNADRVEGEYLVWERSPSYVAAKSASQYWQMMPTLQQFNQMYTTYPVTFLTGTNPTGNLPDGTEQYFLCGG